LEADAAEDEAAAWRPSSSQGDTSWERSERFASAISRRWGEGAAAGDGSACRWEVVEEEWCGGGWVEGGSGGGEPARVTPE